MRILAIDLGLRTGFALYEDGVLVRHWSSRFPSKAAIRKGAWNVLRDLGTLERVVAEGDRLLGEIWEKAATKQGAAFECIDAGVWRRELLYDREQRGSSTAKKSALELALLVIEEDGAPRPASELRDDAAEAILIGLWAVGRELPR